MAPVLTWLMVTNATAYQDTKAKIANTHPTTARVNHAKMVLHVSMNLTATYANAGPVSLVCSAKVCVSNEIMLQVAIFILIFNARFRINDKSSTAHFAYENSWI